MYSSPQQNYKKEQPEAKKENNDKTIVKRLLDVYI